MQRYIDVLRDETGGAIAAAEVRVYVGDTSTLATLYDGAGNVVAQPLSTNASGLIVNSSLDALHQLGFQAAAGRYRLEVTKGTGAFTLPGIELGALDEVEAHAAALNLGKDTTIAAEVPSGSLLSGAMLAAGAIVEQGSNANGSYWRWEGGLQMCRAKRTLLPGSGAHILRNPITPPAAFAADPVATFSTAPLVGPSRSVVMPYVDHAAGEFGLAANVGVDITTANPSLAADLCLFGSWK